MKVIVEINKQVNFRKFPQFDFYLEVIALYALRICRRRQGSYTVSVLLCSDSEIQNLNYKFRGKNKPTNVLSFPDGEKFESVTMLGDIAISVDTIAREAKEQGKTFKTHFLHMFVHGILHLLGMDHENLQDRLRMEQMEDKIIDFVVQDFQKKRQN